MVQLVSLTETELQTYLTGAIDHYAQEHVRAGNWQPEEAHQKSDQEFRQLLPQGVASPNQYLYSIVEASTGQTIGLLWFALTVKGTQRTAFIYDFIIDEDYRGKGYGRQALVALDAQAAALNIESISLHAFAHNQTAIALYQKMGYAITDVHMSKQISR